MKKKSKIIIWVAIIVVVVICLILFLRPKKNTEVQLEQAVVTTKNISTCITATGTVEPINKVDVGTQVSGNITKLYVDYNSVVKKGQKLAELDRVNLEAEVKTAKNNVEAARVQYEYQKKNYERNKALHDKKLISDSEFENDTYNYQTAKINYDRTKSDLVKANTNLGYATIYSPIDGTVISKSVEQGQTVAASFSTPTLFTIAQDLSKMQVVANVDEADIGGVKVGQRVSFTVDAYPQETFQGTVKQVRLQATTTSNVVTYEVIIDAPNDDLKLKPGLTANVNIYTQESNGVLAVPTKALSFSPDKDVIGNAYRVAKNNIRANSKKVYVLSGNTLKAIPVTIGIAGNGFTEIKSGLTLGQNIVTGVKSQSAPTMEEANQSSSPISMPGPGGKNKGNKGGK
jgi:HlyD family secretion protein